MQWVMYVTRQSSADRSLAMHYAVRDRDMALRLDEARQRLIFPPYRPPPQGLVGFGVSSFEKIVVQGGGGCGEGILNKF